MSPGSVVVTGANRGIGLGLIQQLLKDQSIRCLIATARDVEKATELNGIKDPRLHVLQLNVTCDKSIDDFVSKVGEIVGADGLNLLVNNAGIAVPNRSLITEQLDVNTISVVLLTQKLLPLLTKAASKTSGDTLSVSRVAVITISSGLGSITDNTTGSGWYQALAYRMSKSAINQFTRTFAIDTKADNILSVSFAPGWIQTDMGGQNATFTVEEATKDLVDSFSKLRNEHNGGFYDRELKKLAF